MVVAELLGAMDNLLEYLGENLVGQVGDGGGAWDGLQGGTGWR